MSRALHIYYFQYEKKQCQEFFLFVYLQSYNDKIKFSFLETMWSSCSTSYLRMSHSCTKCQYCCFALIYPLYIRKILWENYKVLKIELKMYSPVGLKFVFEMIKFKVLDYIQYDFMHQYSRFSKDQMSMFKSLFINYFIYKYCHTF